MHCRPPELRRMSESHTCKQLLERMGGSQCLAFHARKVKRAEQALKASKTRKLYLQCCRSIAPARRLHSSKIFGVHSEQIVH